MGTCQFCGKETKRPRSHEWQCSKNPSAKTHHFERFRGEPKPSSPEGAPAREAAGAPKVHHFEPDTKAKAAPSKEDDPYLCGKCGADVGGPVATCPECGAANEWQ